MNLKILTSAVFALLIIFSLTYNIVSVKAENNNEEAKDPLFQGTLYKYGECGNITQNTRYVAVDRTTGQTLADTFIHYNGLWGVPGAIPGHLIYVKFTSSDNKVVCLFKTQTQQGFSNIPVCMTNGKACLNEE